MEIRANMPGKITKIRADSGYFITILHKNWGNISTASPPKKKASNPYACA
jgi:hypothetical protein